MAPPAFQFYAADFLASTADMSCAEVGAYLRLLLFQWERGGIPDEPRVIRRVISSTPSSATTLWRSLKGRFSYNEKDQCWKNARLERVRAEQTEFAALGRRGGESRAVKARRVNGKFAPADGPADAPANDQHLPALRSPISDLRSPDLDPNGTGTSPTPSCTDQRTTADSSSAPVENPAPVLVDGDHVSTQQNQNKDLSGREGLRLPAVVRDCEGPAHEEPVVAAGPARMEGVDQGPRDAPRLPVADDSGRAEGHGRRRIRAPDAPMTSVAELVQPMRARLRELAARQGVRL